MEGEGRLFNISEDEMPLLTGEICILVPPYGEGSSV